MVNKSKKEFSVKNLEKVFYSLIKSLNDPTNIILLIILVFSFVIRLKYLSLHTIWMDEARYALISLGLLQHPLHYGGLKLYGNEITRYPPLLPYLLFLSQKILGKGDFAVHVVNPVIGVLSVLAIYFIGKEMISKEVGLIAAFLMATAPYDIFFSERILLDLPHMFFFSLTIVSFYLWWEKGKSWAKYALSLFFMLGLLTKQPEMLAGIVILIYILIFYRLNWLKDKNRLKEIGLVILAFLIFIAPWSIRNIRVCKSPFCSVNFAFRWFSGTEKHGGVDVVKNPFYYLEMLPWVWNQWVFVAAILGMIYMFSRKEKIKEFGLLFIWISVVLLVFSNTSVKVPRYIIATVPPAIVFASYFVWEASNQIVEKRETSLILASIITLFLGYSSLTQGIAMIKMHSHDFELMIAAGKYFANMPSNVAIMSSSPPIISYYGNDKFVVHFPSKESEFEKYLKKYNISYVVIDHYERTEPSWVWSYVPKQKYLIPVKEYFMFYRGQRVPMVIIYKVNKSMLKNE